MDTRELLRIFQRFRVTKILITNVYKHVLMLQTLSASPGCTPDSGAFTEVSEFRSDPSKSYRDPCVSPSTGIGPGSNLDQSELRNINCRVLYRRAGVPACPRRQNNIHGPSGNHSRGCEPANVPKNRHGSANSLRGAPGRLCSTLTETSKCQNNLSNSK